MTQAIVIFGAGGHGRELLQLIEDINEQQPGSWSCLGFLVDAAFTGAQEVAGLPVLGDIAWLAAHPEVKVVVAIGPSAARRAVTQRIVASCANAFATLVHPRAWVGKRVTIGAGSVVCAGALLTTDIHIGDHVHVNIGCSIAHDADLRNYATLYGGVRVTGKVKIGEGAEIGTGAVIVPGCAIGDWSIVGAGAVVTGNVPDDATAVGVPARVVKQRPKGWQLA
jgi:sugar O-acyltransferase (sialic acid O-acetyltransferase NeuD family)